MKKYRWSNRKSRVWNAKRGTRARRQMQLGLAVLLMLFVVVGLTTAIRGKGRMSESAFRENSAADGHSDINDGGKAAGDSKKSSKDKAGGAGDNGTDKKGSGQKANPNIRVLIMTNGFSHTVHSEVKISSESGMTLTYGKKTKEYGKNKTVTIMPDSKYFKKGKICIQPKKGKLTVKSLKRGDGAPKYAGILELQKTAEGIALINELPLEEYLCGVVPSEMPASYELEALKAQAVCARSYAYRQMEDYAYPEYKAHVNDSTDYQVYNNSAQVKRSSQAVKETRGEAVRYNGEVVSTYYYSTSSGKTTTMEAWGTKPNESNGYLKSVKVKGKSGDYEKDLPWYRWKVTVSKEVLSDLLSLNTGKELGTLESVKVTKRGPGDVALTLKAVGDKGSVTVKTENKIRKALGGSEYEIEKQDGSKTSGRDLLPSAFFTIKKKGENYVISGGGFGHGIGMSQTGANEMAKQGKDYREILNLFYNDITIE